MVLELAYAALSKALPSRYWLRLVFVVLCIIILRTLSQGRKTTRERNLNARVILVTGGFTPLGLTLLQELAQRGAHIIALSPEPILSTRIATIIEVLRSTTSNENIFAEECDLTSPVAIREFCSQFSKTKGRLDGIVFAHEYSHIGSLLPTRSNSVKDELERQTRSLATFLFTTQLLELLLVAPTERDIRIVNIINPFYAAAATNFTPSTDSLPKKPSIFLQEGRRSLQTAILTRHLQRILDSMPQNTSTPKVDGEVVNVARSRLQRSNIVAVAVSPGITKTDTIAPLLAANRSDPLRYTSTGAILHFLLQPLLWVLTKSLASGVQSVLHGLFLPTPFKSQASNHGDTDELTVEVLRPGALYADCSVVGVNLGTQPHSKTPSKDGRSEAAKEKGKQTDNAENEPGNLPDDGEMGGEPMGRQVWENFETALRIWENANPAPPKPAVESTGVKAGEENGGGNPNPGKP